MKHLILIFILSITLVAQESTKELSEVNTLKARIIQLETQVGDLSVQNSVLNARLNLATQELGRTENQKKLKEFEKNADCSIDWNSVPPKCK